MAVRVLAVAALVVAVGLLARSPATVARPAGPIASFDKPTPLERFLDSAGTWGSEEVAVEPFSLGPGAWTGRDLVVGFGPQVAAWRDGRWRELPPHPEAPINVGAVMAGAEGEVWVYRHRSCSVCAWEDSLFRLEVEQRRWTRLPDGPPVDLPKLEWLDGLVVLVGEDDGPSRGFGAWAFDVGTRRWRDLGPPPVQPIGFSAVAAGRHLVALMTGTAGRRGPFTMLWNADRGVWTLIDDPPGLTRPEEAALVWTGEEVVAVGGQGPDVGASLSLEANTWTPLPSFPQGPGMPEPRRRSGRDTWELYGLAGAWDGSSAVFVGDLNTPVHVAWSPQDGEWEARLATAPRSSHRAWWTGEELLLWGGFDYVAPFETLSVWSPPS